MKTSYTKYIFITLVIVLLPLGLIASSNFIIFEHLFDPASMTATAEQWQSETGGIVLPPNMGDTYLLFKAMSMLHHASSADTIILGSSTAMGISADLFPTSMHVYSFTTNSNSLFYELPEADYFEHTAKVKWILLDLDWFLGNPYRQPAPTYFNLTELVNNNAKPPVLKLIEDSLSYPRLVDLLGLLQHICSSEHNIDTLKQLFTTAYVGPTYHCYNGVLAKDFDLNHHGTCAGFQWDGSSLFGTQHRLTTQEAHQLILELASPTNEFYTSLPYGYIRQAKGIPNPIALERMATIASYLKKKNGEFIVLMPALLPGYQAKLLELKPIADYIKTTKNIFDAWGKKNNIIIIDADASENVGCTSGEFIDERHAMIPCYAKIFRQFWHDYNLHKIPPGLYQPKTT